MVRRVRESYFSCIPADDVEVLVCGYGLGPLCWTWIRVSGYERVQANGGPFSFRKAIRPSASGSRTS